MNIAIRFTICIDFSTQIVELGNCAKQTISHKIKTRGKRFLTYLILFYSVIEQLIELLQVK